VPQAPLPAVFPGNQSFAVSSFADETDGGNSKNLGHEIKNNVLYFRFILKKGIPFPWAKVVFAHGDPARSWTYPHMKKSK
jgi:hypothetical protein